MRLARHFGFPKVDDFLATLTPREYTELAWSFEYDPPADDLLRDLLFRTAQLLSAFYNANTGKDATKTETAQFLAVWGETFPDDGDADEPADEAVAVAVAAALAAKDEMRAGLNVSDQVRHVAPLMRNPNVRAVPEHVFAALTRHVDE